MRTWSGARDVDECRDERRERREEERGNRTHGRFYTTTVGQSLDRNPEEVATCGRMLGRRPPSMQSRTDPTRKTRCAGLRWGAPSEGLAKVGKTDAPVSDMGPDSDTPSCALEGKGETDRFPLGGGPHGQRIGRGSSRTTAGDMQSVRRVEASTTSISLGQLLRSRSSPTRKSNSRAVAAPVKGSALADEGRTRGDN